MALSLEKPSIAYTYALALAARIFSNFLPMTNTTPSTTSERMTTLIWSLYVLMADCNWSCGTKE